MLDPLLQTAELGLGISGDSIPLTLLIGREFAGTAEAGDIARSFP